MKRFVLGMVIVIAGCKVEKQTYGGSTSGSYTPPSGSIDYSLAQNLVASSSLKLHFNASQVTKNAGKIDKIINMKLPADLNTTADYDLVPASSNVEAEISDDWLKISANASASFFSGTIQQDISSASTTVVALVRADSVGDFISFDPLDREAQAFSISAESGRAIARFWSSPNDYVDVSEPLPANGNTVLVASFGNDVGLISLSVNGSLNSITTPTGNPTAPFDIARFLSLGSSAAGRSSYLKELYVFNRALTKQEMGAMITLMAAQNKVTGIILNTDLKAPSTGPVTDVNFAPAKAVIQNNCNACHSSWSSGSATYFKNLGLVTKGNAENSPLYYRIKNSTGSAGPKNMPQSGNISNADADLIKTWINNMN